MREFYLINSKGKRIDLNDTASFFYNPEGLGFSYNTEYKRAENQFVTVESVLEQKSIEGTIKFNNYKGYTEFIKFLQSKPLTLEYKPDGADTYRISCIAKSVKKGEKDGLWLSCDISLEGLGQWYKYIYLETDPDAKGKSYTYQYPFKYTNASSNSVKLESESSLASPVTITFIGPVKNPSWSHYVNGELAAEGKIFCDIEEGHRVKVTSVMPMAIVETDAAGNEIQDLYGNSDFSTARFLNIELGTNIITCRSESPKTHAIVEGFEYYESI